MGQLLSSSANNSGSSFHDEETLLKAAKIICDADVLLFATGAGMSADSGLPVFADAAKCEPYKKRNLTYKDIAHTHWLQDDPALFYGFSGNLLSSYRKTEPHDGYKIVKKWKDSMFGDENPVSEDIKRKWEQFKVIEMQQADKYETCPEITGLPGAFYVYTSNVDGFSQKAGFTPSEVYEIHGCIENWQCSKPCTNEVWEMPKEYSFDIDPKTLQANVTPPPDYNPISESLPYNRPMCKLCGAPARPRVCYFKDLTWTYPAHAHARYLQWVETVKRISKEKPDLKVVILEIGCGILVNSVRMQTRHLREQVLKDTYCHTIRINPDFPNADDDTVPKDKITGLRGKALEILRALDENIAKIKEQQL